MAEAVVGVVTENILNEAVSLASEEFSLVFRFKNGLQSLAREVESIRALVADADRKDIPSEFMQLWLKRLKLVAYDAEALLEEYKYQLLHQKMSRLMPQKKWDKVCNLFSPITKLAIRFEMAHKIKHVNSKLKSLKEQGIGYGLNPSEFLINRSSEVKMDRITSPSIQEKDIVGRDEDVIEVVDMLVNAKSEEHLAIIGIVGMGGQGKTVLAQLVYKDDKVVNHFERRIWVCISDDFKVERVLNEIVQSITGTNPNLTNREALIQNLQGTLKGKRYLLVLDDVWNEDQEKWESMECDLREINGSLGTRVMVTTRSYKVVATMRVFHTHHLSRLSDADSWTLFRKRAFAVSGAVETPDFVAVGQRIVQRCSGVPLAIKALGGLLYSKKDIAEWLSVEDSDIWSLTNSEAGVLSSIKLSYNYLPSVSIKQCFAYCSVFPKDIEIDRKNLIQLWMAQGFLNPPKRSCLQMEDLGNDYFNILLWNSLLQEPTYDEYNKIQSCKMHDIVHDFASLISQDYCSKMKVGQGDKKIEAVHLSLVSGDDNTVDMSKGIPRELKTLYLLSGIIGNELIKFRYLRTLILSDYKIEQLPSSIDRLKQLRYIDIIYTKIEKLPASYVKLYNLQTLRVALKMNSIIFLGSLINLRHVDLGSERECMLVGISQLTHLQTLPYFIVSDKVGCKIEELGPLNNLTGSLIIYGLDKVKNGEEAQRANISKKSKIDHLELIWLWREVSNLNEDDVIASLKPHSNLKRLAIKNFRGSRFPSWMTSELLMSLVELELHGCDSCKQFPPIGRLPFLRSLSIERCEKLATLPSLQAFPSLEKLKISNVDIVSLPEMPSSLSSLRIEECEKLAALPSLEGLLSLEELEIVNLGVVSLPKMHHGLPSLRSLNISMCEKLIALPRWLGLCTSLETLYIFDCPALQGVDGYGLERLPNLKYLQIGELSKELAYFPWPCNTVENGKDAQLEFASLNNLVLWGWPKLTSLPEQLQHLPSLRTLSIWYFEELKVLPEWLGNIQSLQYLELYKCQNLEYMPSAEAMQRLTNLQVLNIHSCLRMDERCNKESGPEWHKLAHIPKPYVSFRNIQSQN